MLQRLTVTAGLAALFVSLWVVGATGEPPAARAVIDVGTSPTAFEYRVVPEALTQAAPPLEYVDQCERLRVDEQGRVRRIRKYKTPAARDQLRRETRAFLTSFAQDVEPRGWRPLAKALHVWALRESSYNPTAVHILSPDIESNQRASRHERVLSSAYAGASVPVHDSAGQVVDRVSAWWQGRGLFGMTSALYVWRAGPDAPPWVLCDRQVAATVMVQALRDQLRQCVAQGYPSTYRTLNRRFSSGHCRKRDAKFEAQWDKRAAAQGLDPDAAAKL